MSMRRLRSIITRDAELTELGLLEKVVTPYTTQKGAEGEKKQRGCDHKQTRFIHLSLLSSLRPT